MTRPPLTRAIGTAERSLQALLQRQLAPAGLDFTGWVILVHLHTEALSSAALTEKLRLGQVAEGGAAAAALSALAARGVIAEGPQGWAQTATGQALFGPLRAKVAALTAALEDGIPEADLATTDRVLSLIAARAGA